jgi:hypothetical protein
MDVFVWDGAAVSLGEIDVLPISLCRAVGPLEILPPSQLIGCVVIDNQMAWIGNELACGAHRDVRLQDDGTLLWIARSSAASNEVTMLPWNGFGFDRGQSYVACWDDPLTPIVDPIDCGR